MNSIFILSLFFIIFGIMLIKGFKLTQNYIFCIFITLVIILFCFNVESSLKASKDGLILCFNAIIPTVFTFSVICNLLILYDGISIYSKILGPLICKPLRLDIKCAFPIAASMLSGYPLGAKYSSDLYALKHIDFNQYNRLTKIASNAGPIFIIGAIGTSLLGDVKYGYFLLIGNFLSIFFIALITRPKNYTYTKEKISKTKFKPINFGHAIDTAISNSLKTTLTVCGYVIAFSVLISFFKNSVAILQLINSFENLIGVTKNTLYNLILGSIEMTNGCNLVAHSTLTIHLKLATISFFLSFSGFSIIAQTSSFISKHGISIISYTLSKLFQGVFSFILTFSLSKFIFFSQETWSGEIEKATSISHFILVASLALIIPFFIYKLKELFHSS